MEVETQNAKRKKEVHGSFLRFAFRLLRWGYFFAPPLASGAGVAAVAAAPASPVAAASSFLAFFFRTTFWTRVFGSPNGLLPSAHLPSSIIFRIRSDRFSTHRVRVIPPLRFRLLSMDMARGP